MSKVAAATRAAAVAPAPPTLIFVSPLDLPHRWHRLYRCIGSRSLCDACDACMHGARCKMCALQSSFHALLR